MGISKLENASCVFLRTNLSDIRLVITIKVNNEWEIETLWFTDNEFRSFFQELQIRITTMYKIKFYDISKKIVSTKITFP